MLAEFLSAFIPMFIVADPFWGLALLLSLTQGMERSEERRLIKRTILYATVILVGFAAAGRMILGGLGVQMYSLQIAGGLLLLTIGGGMVAKGETGAKPRGKEDIAVVPLAIPALAGPGTISLSIVLMQTTPWWIVFLAIIVTMLTCGLIFLASDAVYKVIGENGARALTRVMGFLTAAFAIQYMLDGVGAWLKVL